MRGAHMTLCHLVQSASGGFGRFAQQREYGSARRWLFRGPAPDESHRQYRIRRSCLNYYANVQQQSGRVDSEKLM
jgi:hypothetical protein